MSAPITKKPHHVRDELCTTRAPYRQGRELRAVKVYTVNQESKYLLIQGVPGVGAHQELVSLFALYGTVEEYRLLDEYPAEEYTDVMWIKFQILQSARVAKRKLDDYAFYGGTLHVCYAPEFETVQETREKLQDRRKAIAARVRKLEIENEQRLAHAGITSKPSSFKSVASASTSHTGGDSKAIATVRQGERKSQAASSSSAHGSGEECGGPPPKQDWIPPWSLPLPPPRHPPLFLNSWHPEPYPCNTSQPPHLRVLPMSGGPFQSHPMTVAQPVGHGRTTVVTSGGHKRVPSAQATFPPDYDPRLPDKTDHPSQSEEANLPVVNGGAEHTDDIKEGAILRDYKPPKCLSKFVPRQVTKKPLRLPTSRSQTILKSESQSKNNKVELVDIVNENLKKEAFIIGKKTGPQLPTNEDEKRCTFKQTESGSESVDKSVLAIRKRVQEFSTVAPPPQLKQKKKKS